MGYQGLNMSHWHARQVSYLSYYLSGPIDVLLMVKVIFLKELRNK